MKSEPSAFSINDLQDAPRRTDCWDGVRNYEARNFLRDGMRPRDLAFFYHSSCPRPGIVGVMEIVRAGYPDSTAFDPQEPHYDPRSDPVRPRWYMVDVRYRRKTRRLLGLPELRCHPGLVGLRLLQRGSRLSVMPVSRKHWHLILELEAQSPLGDPPPQDRNNS